MFDSSTELANDRHRNKGENVNITRRYLRNSAELRRYLRVIFAIQEHYLLN